MPTCALCNAEDATPCAVAPRDETVMLCATCRAGVEEGPQDGPHWQCLNEAIWSPEPAVQVLAYRLLKALPEAPWARDILDIAYLEPEVLSWAEAGLSDEPLQMSGTVLDPILYTELRPGRLRQLALVVFGTTLLMGLYPALKATRVTPVEAIQKF